MARLIYNNNRKNVSKHNGSVFATSTNHNGIVEMMDATRPPYVSIIIPIYKCVIETIDQINNWLWSDLDEEIIQVIDGCPYTCPDKLLDAWEIKHKHLPYGRIIQLAINQGFAAACNEGAKHAKGEILVFLNADTIITTRWLEPMLEQLHNDVGIVGNLQLKQNGDVDSAGSEWNWESLSFEHIGRNVLHGKRLHETININNIPLELLKANERQMVTGCCLMIKKSVFDSVGGFDVGYRQAYWEDADLNMKVREKGLKVRYAPASVIYHKTGSSSAGGHPWMLDNAQHFHKKWLRHKELFKPIKY